MHTALRAASRPTFQLNLSDLTTLPLMVLGTPPEEHDLVTRRLRARREHGGGEVLVYSNGDYGYGGQRLTSCRKLMRALYGRDSGMTHDRYFRLGKWAKTRPTKSTILEAMGTSLLQVDLDGRGGPEQSPRRTCPGAAGRWYSEQVGLELALLEALGLEPGWVEPTEPRVLPVQPWVSLEPEEGVLQEGASSGGDGLGFDLGARAHEVRKLLFKGYGSWMARSHYNPEDVLQEVYKGLLTRAQGKSRFDPSKSSFGHYIHMVCGSVLANYHRKRGKRREHEQVGMLGMDSEHGGLTYMDASQASDMMDGSDMLLSGATEDTSDHASWGLALDSMEEHLVECGVGDLAVQTLEYTTQGYTRSEIAEALDENAGRVGRALAKLRRAARSWDY